MVFFQTSGLDETRLLQNANWAIQLKQPDVRLIPSTPADLLPFHNAQIDQIHEVAVASRAFFQIGIELLDFGKQLPHPTKLFHVRGI